MHEMPLEAEVQLVLVLVNSSKEEHTICFCFKACSSVSLETVTLVGRKSMIIETITAKGSPETLHNLPEVTQPQSDRQS